MGKCIIVEKDRLDRYWLILDYNDIGDYDHAENNDKDHYVGGDDSDDDNYAYNN